MKQYLIWLSLVVAMLAALGWLFSVFGVKFAGGFLLASVLTQIAVRIKYGEWL